MKFKEFIKNLCTNVIASISRFPIAFICSVLLFAAGTYVIISQDFSSSVIFESCLTLLLVTVLSVLLKTVQEYISDKLTDSIQYIICAVAAVASFIPLKIYSESLYTYMAYAGVIIALVCFIFFVLMRGENRDRIFPKLITSMIFSQVICSVISIGTAICSTAFQFLLFSWNSFDKLSLIVQLFIWTVVEINIFLSFIPKKDVPIHVSKIFRAIVLFAGLPLYMLLITILLVYLAKIVIIWNMPVGGINWFASFASLFFIFFLMSVMQYPEKGARLFVRFGGYCLFPVLIMQAVAVFERISAYGLTTPRTVSLVLILISILFIVGSVFIPAHLNKIALASGIIVLIVTVTPFNVIDMPIASQTSILKNALIANDMLKDGKVIPNPNVSDKDAQRIYSAYDYLKNDAEKLPDFIPDENKDPSELFGFVYDGESNNNEDCDYKTKDSVDISGYDKMLSISYVYDTLTFEHNGTERSIDLKQIAKDLYDQHGSENSDLELYKVDENTALYFRSFYFNYCDKNGDIESCAFSGQILLKN